MADTTDLTEKELSQVDACVAVVRQKEAGSEIYGPAMLITDTIDRLVQEVRRRRDVNTRILIYPTTHYNLNSGGIDYPVVRLSFDGIQFETRPLETPAMAVRIANEAAAILGVDVKKP